jgi:hypothetical protein
MPDWEKIQEKAQLSRDRELKGVPVGHWDLIKSICFYKHRFCTVI